MENGPQFIALSRLAVGLIPALVVIGILWRWSLGARTGIYAIARMIVQLVGVGYALTYIFAAEHGAIVLGVLMVMLMIASWIGLRPVAAQRRRLYGRMALSLALGAGVTVAVVTGVVLDLEPWFFPRYFIPLSGMALANAMNAVSLAAERWYSEVERGSAPAAAREAAMRAALIPLINSLLATGLVSFPGLMTGQILSGVSPLLAARYQIMVMGLVFGAAGLSTATFLHLVGTRVPTPEQASSA